MSQCGMNVFLMKHASSFMEIVSFFTLPSLHYLNVQHTSLFSRRQGLTTSRYSYVILWQHNLPLGQPGWPYWVLVGISGIPKDGHFLRHLRTILWNSSTEYFVLPLRRTLFHPPRTFWNGSGAHWGVCSVSPCMHIEGAWGWHWTIFCPLSMGSCSVLVP